MILLIPLALAEPFIADTGFTGCTGEAASIVVIPPHEAVGVPVDLAPTFATRGFCGGFEAPYQITLRRGADVVHSEIRETGSQTDRQGEIRFWATTAPVLDPQTEYTLEVQPAFGAIQGVRFTTGEEQVQPGESLPSVALLDVVDRGFGFSATLEVTPSSPWEFVVVRANGNPIEVTATGGTVPVVWNHFREEKQFCASAIQRTPDGRFLGPSAEACGDSKGCGCQTPSSSGSAMTALFRLWSRR